MKHPCGTDYGVVVGPAVVVWNINRAAAEVYLYIIYAYLRNRREVCLGGVRVSALDAMLSQC